MVASQCTEEEDDLPQPSSSSIAMASCSTAQSRSEADPDQAVLKCPRCHSLNTKFCYYNNYSFTQPRHFCKSCKRYWTEGGTLRNVPVGGGCRKNKRINCQNSHAKSSASQTRNSASCAFVAAAGNEDGGEGGERFALHERQGVKRCRTEKQGLTSELSSLSLFSQLHGLPHLDSAYSDLCSSPSLAMKSPDLSFFHHSNDGLSQTLTQSSSDVGHVSLTEGSVVSDIEPGLANCMNLGFDLREKYADRCNQQQQEKKQSMAMDQILADEKAWRHESAEAMGQMRDQFLLHGSQKLPYDFKDEVFDWEMGSEGFDPTNDLSYMGGPEFWSDFPIVDAGSGTVI